MKPTANTMPDGNPRLSHAIRTTRASEASAKTRGAIAAATVGCMLEWYDFAIYGYFAVVISRLFFPTHSQGISLLLSVATFGVGFAMRPIGALVFGTMADRRGRRVALTWTVVTMVLGTLLIVATPTYASIGIAAPIVIVIARLIQGFSAGGEMGSALSYLVEYAPKSRKIYFASFQQLTQLLALLFGSLVGMAVNGSLSAASVEAWGWRLPFLLGLLIAPVGWYIRTQTEEPPAFAKVLERRQQQALAGIREEKPSPWRTFVEYPRETLGGFCITVLWTASTYVFLVFMPTYAVKELGFAASAALLSNSISLVVAAVCVPFFALLADRIGPSRILTVSALAISACIYPALAVLGRNPNLPTLVMVQSGFAVLIACFTGPAGGALASLFPDEKRSMGVSIAYNFAVTIFGGFAPFIATWLIQSTGDKLSPAYYLAGAGIVALIGVVLAKPSLKNH